MNFTNRRVASIPWYLGMALVAKVRCKEYIREKRSKNVLAACEIFTADTGQQTALIIFWTDINLLF